MKTGSWFINGNPLIGYMDRGEWPDGVATYDPGYEAACPVCHAPVRRHGDPHLKQVAAVTLMKGPDRCYFYRAHKDCLADDLFNGNQRQDAIIDDIDLEEDKRAREKNHP